MAGPVLNSKVVGFVSHLFGAHGNSSGPGPRRWMGSSSSHKALARSMTVPFWVALKGSKEEKLVGVADFKRHPYWMFGVFVQTSVLQWRPGVPFYAERVPFQGILGPKRGLLFWPEVWGMPRVYMNPKQVLINGSRSNAPSSQLPSGVLFPFFGKGSPSKSTNQQRIFFPIASGHLSHVCGIRSKPFKLEAVRVTPRKNLRRFGQEAAFSARPQEEADASSLCSPFGVSSKRILRVRIDYENQI